MLVVFSIGLVVGPLVAITLIAKGRSPKYVIGSASLSDFFVTLTNAILSFYLFIGITHWQVIAKLMMGGVIAAPLAAKLAGKLPIRIMLGRMAIIWNLKIFLKLI